MAKPAHAFRIVFKSGYVQDVRADKLEVGRNKAADAVVNLKWTNMTPRYVTACLGAIESIWQLD